VGTPRLKPERWLGATAPGGLALPDAQPTPAHLYAPRGVYLNDDVLVVVDSGNHRVLIWYGMPGTDHAAADVVIGQADFTSEGSKLFHLPTGVAVHAGALYVADAWHHRILVWHRIPERNGAAPDAAIGQRDLAGVEVNRGGSVSRTSMYWPYGVSVVDGNLYVADTGNRRVLIWDGVPLKDEPPSRVLGQSDFESNGENRGVGVDERSFRWAHDVAGDASRTFVADAGDHRVLGFDAPIAGDAKATLVIGQPTFASSSEYGYAPQGPAKLRFPYSISYDRGTLAVADTANNRVLLFDRPAAGAGASAYAVVGQTGFDANGENEWKAVTPATLCWPYGIHLHAGKLAIADSGNNRVMIWSLGSEARAGSDLRNETLAAPGVEPVTHG
jgi:hypothetical protein